MVSYNKVNYGMGSFIQKITEIERTRNELLHYINSTGKWYDNPGTQQKFSEFRHTIFYNAAAISNIILRVSSKLPDDKKNNPFFIELKNLTQTLIQKDKPITRIDTRQWDDSDQIHKTFRRTLDPKKVRKRRIKNTLVAIDNICRLMLFNYNSLPKDIQSTIESQRAR